MTIWPESLPASTRLIIEQGERAYRLHMLVNAIEAAKLAARRSNQPVLILRNLDGQCELVLEHSPAHANLILENSNETWEIVARVPPLEPEDPL